MPRQCRRARGGLQWRRNLRNVLACQAAAAAPQPPPAAAAAPPPAVAAPPPPLPRAPIHPRGRLARRGALIHPRGRLARRVAGRAPPPIRRPILPAGRGEKNIDNAFIRNRRRYKIKRIMAAPKNVEVKHRHRTVRRMVARRRAVYPALRQQRKY